MIVWIRIYRINTFEEFHVTQRTIRLLFGETNQWIIGSIALSGDDAERNQKQTDSKQMDFYLQNT